MSLTKDMAGAPEDERPFAAIRARGRPWPVTGVCLAGALLLLATWLHAATSGQGRAFGPGYVPYRRWSPPERSPWRSGGCGGCGPGASGHCPPRWRVDDAVVWAMGELRARGGGGADRAWCSWCSSSVREAPVGADAGRASSHAAGVGGSDADAGRLLRPLPAQALPDPVRPHRVGGARRGRPRGAAGRGVRAARPQRRGQDHLHQVPPRHRPPRRGRGGAARRPPGGSAHPRPRGLPPGAARAARRVDPARLPGQRRPAEGPPGRPRRPGRAARPGRTRRGRRSGGSAASARGCASGSGSPRRWSARRTSWCSTSPPTGWTRSGGSRSASCSPPSSRGGPRSSSTRTCSRRPSASAPASASSPAGGWSARARWRRSPPCSSAGGCASRRPRRCRRGAARARLRAASRAEAGSIAARRRPALNRALDGARAAGALLVELERGLARPRGRAHRGAGRGGGMTSLAVALRSACGRPRRGAGSWRSGWRSTGLLLLLVTSLRLEVVDGALAATRLFGQPLVHDIQSADVALRPVFLAASQLVFWGGLAFGVLSCADFAPALLSPGRIEHLLSLPVRRWELLAGTFLGVLVLALGRRGVRLGRAWSWCWAPRPASGPPGRWSRPCSRRWPSGASTPACSQSRSGCGARRCPPRPGPRWSSSGFSPPTGRTLLDLMGRGVGRTLFAGLTAVVPPLGKLADAAGALASSAPLAPGGLLRLLAGTAWRSPRRCSRSRRGASSGGTSDASAAGCGCSPPPSWSSPPRGWCASRSRGPRWPGPT